MIAIAAMALNRVIGSGGGIPWRLPGDLRFFKRTTTGHVVVMGRRTYESIGRPLPDRENIVITRGAFAAPGVRVLRRPEDVAEPGDGRRVYVIGGAQIYEALLPRCGEVLMTQVHRTVAGDVFFPEFEAEFGPPEIIESGPDYEIRRYVRASGSNFSETALMQ
jgi:dihydrofolate reductase